MSENSPKAPASEKINTPEQRDRQAKLLTRFLDIAEHIGPLEGGKVVDELKTEEDRRFLLEQLSNQQIVRLVNGINGLLRGKDKSLWVMDGGEVKLEGFIGTQIPPKSEDKLDLLEKAFNGMRNMARDDRSMEDIAILGSLSINAVHPYAEANGRTSRLLYLLLTEGYNPEVKPSIKTALGEYGREHIDISPGYINFRITDLITTELGINDAEKNINRIGGWIPSGTGPYEEMQFQDEITEDLKRDFIRLIREDYRYTFFALYIYVNNLSNKKDFLEEYSPHSAIVLNKLVQSLTKENLEEILSIYWELKRRHTELLIDCVANPQKPEYVIQEEDQETTILDSFKKQIKQQRGFPKKRIERITEIEVRPAQEVLDEIYYGSPDYSDYDIPDEFVLGEEEIEKPQDPLEGMSKAERKEFRRKRRLEFRENIQKRSLGIASVIREIKKAVLENPDSSVESLMGIAREKASELNLSEEGELFLFQKALEGYEKRHKMVEKYREMYPSDNDLFEACFGVKPQGEVKVIKRPMTLHIQCFSPEDYVAAYNYYKIRKDIADISDADRERALLSGGAALSKVKIKELEHVITIENASFSFTYEVVREKKTKEIHQEETSLILDAQEGDVDIEIKGVGHWKLKIVERMRYGMPSQFQLFDLNNGESLVFDVTKIEPEGKQIFGLLKKAGEENLYGNILIPLRSQDGKLMGYFNMDYLDLKIQDMSPNGTIIRYEEDEGVKKYDSERSMHVQDHEEQHQINDLFEPKDPIGWFKAVRGAVKSRRNFEEARNMVAYSLVKNERRSLMDERARDEIISFYHEGDNTADIFSFLSRSPLYDYATMLKAEIEKLPQKISEEIESQLSQVVYQRYEDENEKSDSLVEAIPLKVDSKEAKAYVGSVFGEEYKKDLQKWLNAITLLEQKGYSREEIVSLLIQEPILTWNGLARRLGPKG